VTVISPLHHLDLPPPQVGPLRIEGLSPDDEDKPAS
jgi:hypothetical protein